MTPTSNRKLPRAERHAQLLETARAILRGSGADALTLGYLAERAGVSKPIAYEHFATREGLLIELSRQIEERHAQGLRNALARTEDRLEAVAATVSSAYIGCAVDNGLEWQAISGALKGNAEMIAVQRELADEYVALLCTALAPFTDLPAADLRLRCFGIAGAAEAITRELVCHRADAGRATANLSALITGAVAPDGTDPDPG
jgi:AcrR family transcriptional regulator